MDYYMQSPIGTLLIQESNDTITNITFHTQEKMSAIQTQESSIQISFVIKECVRQLNLYFKGELKEFNLPLAPKGTDFQESVWKALCQVPYGTTASYKDIAIAIGNPKACRAIGMANNHNPIPIIIPCHRIIGSNGKLVGYAGGLDIKEKLLELEKQNMHRF